MLSQSPWPPPPYDRVVSYGRTLMINRRFSSCCQIYFYNVISTKPHFIKMLNNCHQNETSLGKWVWQEVKYFLNSFRISSTISSLFLGKVLLVFSGHSFGLSLNPVCCYFLCNFKVINFQQVLSFPTKLSFYANVSMLKVKFLPTMLLVVVVVSVVVIVSFTWCNGRLIVIDTKPRYTVILYIVVFLK